MNFNLRRLIYWSLPAIGIGYLAYRRDGEEKAEENTETKPQLSES